MSGLTILSGACHPLYCFEVGFQIDLDAAERAQEGSERAALQHRERPAGPFEMRPAPLRVTEPLDGVTLPFSLGGSVEIVLYDFGAASVSYTIPLDPDPGKLLDLSVSLRGQGGLAADARRRIERLVERLGAAVHRPRVAQLMEDYFVFEITEWDGPADAASLVGGHGELLARVLRAETGDLSLEEIADAIEARISFGRREVTLVDWDSAVIVDERPADLRAVLEYANVQLLELRHLDDNLDELVERSYQLVGRRTGWRAVWPSFLAEELRSLSTMQVESAVLLERVTNALKFLGEEYLARLYRLGADRLHLGEWAGSIGRKLETVDDIYKTMSTRAAGRRMELLEWVIILLIASEMAVALLR
ncbi:MAG TPA: hypothetical protein VFU23_00140 [Gemmatimonadales bacterium]|nr:hypothetical protein [Gemmatimonadales bacterium]